MPVRFTSLPEHLYSKHSSDPLGAVILKGEVPISHASSRSPSHIFPSIFQIFAKRGLRWIDSAIHNVHNQALEDGSRLRQRRVAAFPYHDSTF